NSLGGDQIANNLAVSVGTNFVTFTVPIDAPCIAAGTTTFARFRISTAGGLSTAGPAADGEVEDYKLILAPYWTSKGA
ncbi:GEVED domain-containing protein, partial [Escherichia coli]|uniref:GEVED domain-containing protein n=1 Tax=Escherichia coli TaxID=562 RepID=UPI003F482E0A